MSKTYFRFSMITFSFLIFISTLQAAVVHSHSSQHHKEREKDGAYSPRNRWHSSDSDEHNNEFDHEAIVGSAKEAEVYDHLSAEESKWRLRILLTKMDLNEDKQIDRKELKAWILRSFKMLSKEEAQEHLEDADENGDGQISWNEYVTDAYGSNENDGTISVDKENEQLIEDDKIMWKVADVNGDGVLEGNEWLAFSHPEEHPEMLPHILEQTLRDKDTDKDGFISFQEYVGERGQDHNKEWLHVEKDKFDHELDKDGDGKLNGNEILSWVVPSNEEIADEEVAHLFSVSDDDDNDVLSFDEIVNHHDTFVGSEATDYGDQLQNVYHLDDEL